MRRAVEYGEYWHATQMGPTELAKKAAYMKQYSASVGRESPPRLSFRGTLNFTDGLAGDRPPLHGTTEDIIADLQAYAEAGVDHAAMEISGETYADKFRAMDRFVAEVKPKVSA